ncbi:sensor histidine kinase [Ottowia testudinis]|uniref:histidine kinase n=1 Tax=Ottowia testudinis TaxID=2816950 RepID=A0A975H344_9BURK|nr:sensor histidine kinase [Ottowia testudinis]QTD45513.1 sensor histidine kinase [Ottowia testudinis]
MTAPQPPRTDSAKPRRTAARQTTAGVDAAASASAPAQLWQAFDEAVALLQPHASAAVAWCSAAFAQRLGCAAPQIAALPLTALCQRLDGLAAGLAALEAARDAAATWQGVVRVRHAAPEAAHAKTAAHAAPAEAPPDACQRATLRALPGGALALRLQPEPEQQRATRRHLEDRERLLFTSRSVAVGEMATTLAHELNQPLGAVTNVLRGLKARIGAAIAQPQPGALPMLEQGVQLALDQVQYAARIIGRIRDYTQSRQPRRERVDVNALLHNSLTLLDWDLERHGVQLSIERAPGTEGAAPVAGDGVMLQQVMVNLLRNAIEALGATPAGQRQLAIASRIDDAGQLEITIADTGCGIGEEGAAQLFMPFYSTKPNGMGIGLNICRSLIELHQGRLWFTPNAPQGSVFHVALPLASAAEAEQLPHFLDAEESAP